MALEAVHLGQRCERFRHWHREQIIGDCRAILRANPRSKGRTGAKRQSETTIRRWRGTGGRGKSAPMTPAMSPVCTTTTSSNCSTSSTSISSIPHVLHQWAWVAQRSRCSKSGEDRNAKMRTLPTHSTGWLVASTCGEAALFLAASLGLC
jgi:hypothetical protein